MSPPSSPPVCPACDRPTEARPVRGVMTWVCETEDCPVIVLADSRTPPPARTPTEHRRTRDAREHE
jgi:hypothetical protein